jgi:hypothetical protein
VILPVSIFWHFNIISHKFRSCCINSVSSCMWSQMYCTYTHIYLH